ncbi:ABC transporter family substrate-binding protein [Microbacterium sp. YY-03]|uniref:ABC transporter family substrate-binding protein n=1 Tax=Microbacterium sp. YY-03 TaxID=3421636 RepID=UPI003D17A122
MSNKTWRKRALATTAGLGFSALILAGCTTPGATDPSTKPSEGTGSGEVVDATITLAEANEVTSFNVNTPQANLDINSKLSYATHDTFGYVNDKLEIVPNEGFGTYEKVSDDPLTVKYTLNKGLEWSDGDAIDTDDLVFGWAVESGYFDDASFDAEGNVTSGTQYFTIAGSTEGIRDSKITEVSDDKLSLTIEYDTPFVDWNLVWLLEQPVHVVAEKAGVTVDEIVGAITDGKKGDTAAPAAPIEPLVKAAEVFNSAFDATSLPDDPSLYLSNGPFIVDSWEPTQSMTLKVNENYKGTLKPAYSSLVFRFIGDSQAQVSALQNGEVDIINPQAATDTLTALQAIPTATVLTGDQLSYDHVDINFKGEFADPTVREAFMKVIPRQQIVDTLIKPINPEATVLNSQVYVTSQGKVYEDSAKNNGSSAYADVDVEGAKALLAGKTPTVRILYNINNPNRVAAFEAISAKATEAGFVVENVGDAKWGSMLGSDVYDVSIFGWISPGVGNVSIPQIFATNGGGNYNGISVPEIDELASQIMVQTDDAGIVEIGQKVDKLLFDNYYGLPLFQSPGVIAHSDRVSGVTYMANQTGPIWNYWEWTAAAN